MKKIIIIIIISIYFNFYVSAYERNFLEFQLSAGRFTTDIFSVQNANINGKWVLGCNKLSINNKLFSRSLTLVFRGSGHNFCHHTVKGSFDIFSDKESYIGSVTFEIPLFRHNELFVKLISNKFTYTMWGFTSRWSPSVQIIISKIPEDEECKDKNKTVNNNVENIRINNVNTQQDNVPIPSRSQVEDQLNTPSGSKVVNPDTNILKTNN